MGSCFDYISYETSSTSQKCSEQDNGKITGRKKEMWQEQGCSSKEGVEDKMQKFFNEIVISQVLRLTAEAQLDLIPTAEVYPNSIALKKCYLEDGQGMMDVRSGMIDGSDNSEENVEDVQGEKMQSAQGYHGIGPNSDERALPCTQREDPRVYYRQDSKMSNDVSEGEKVDVGHSLEEEKSTREGSGRIQIWSEKGDKRCLKFCSEISYHLKECKNGMKSAIEKCGKKIMNIYRNDEGEEEDERIEIIYV